MSLIKKPVLGSKRQLWGCFVPACCWLSFYIILSTLTACYSTPPVLKVALVGPFEGAYRAVGYDVIYSARLAVREINEQGGIGGYRVALVALDDGGDSQLAHESAVSVINDPAIVAVVGHWLPETTAVAAPLYQEAGLLFIPMGGASFGEIDPEKLPAPFLEAYEAVTPFDETAGAYAGSAYDAFQLIWQALETAAADTRRIDRPALLQSAADLSHIGLTGQLYQLP